MEGVVIVAFRRAPLREPDRLQIAEEHHQAFILLPGLAGFVSHLLFGAVNEVAPTFLGQWAVPLSGQGARIREQLVERS